MEEVGFPKPQNSTLSSLLIWIKAWKASKQSQMLPTCPQLEHTQTVYIFYEFTESHIKELTPQILNFSDHFP